MDDDYRKKLVKEKGDAIIALAVGRGFTRSKCDVFGLDENNLGQFCLLPDETVTINNIKIDRKRRDSLVHHCLTRPCDSGTYSWPIKERYCQTSWLTTIGRKLLESDDNAIQCLYRAQNVIYALRQGNNWKSNPETIARYRCFATWSPFTEHTMMYREATVIFWNGVSTRWDSLNLLFFSTGRHCSS